VKPEVTSEFLPESVTPFLNDDDQTVRQQERFISEAQRGKPQSSESLATMGNPHYSKQRGRLPLHVLMNSI
jgi:hypothetical protein